MTAPVRLKGALPPHGDHRRYLKGCRCDSCRYAMAAWHRVRLRGDPAPRHCACRRQLGATTKGDACYGCIQAAHRERLAAAPLCAACGVVRTLRGVCAGCKEQIAAHQRARSAATQK